MANAANAAKLCRFSFGWRKSSPIANAAVRGDIGLPRAGAGATSELGQAFEAGLAIFWLKCSGLIEKSSSQCNQQVAFAGLDPVEWAALQEPFDGLMK